MSRVFTSCATPSNQLPLRFGEFQIPKTVGTVNIDGVDVEQRDENFPEYEFNQPYVFAS